ncbi:MAG: PIG-L deacetylase family protein [Bacillota bacterium]|nr:PIG-L deacetylase family protein [Bacillota bacterium]
MHNRGAVPKRRAHPLVLLCGVALLAGVAHIGINWRAVPVRGDPELVRAAGEELVSTPRRVLVVAAHPDDVEWYTGGTLIRMALAGSEVTLLLATDGERGRGPDVHPDLGAVRRAEQAEAALRMGCSQVVSLGLPDMGLRGHDELQALIRKTWEQVDPEVVITFDARYPQFPYVHPDHQAVGRAAAAIFDGLAGPRPALLLFHSRRPDTVIDITASISGKIHALNAHRTQGFLGGEPAMMVGRAGAAGRSIGTGFGEAFRRR